VTEDWREGPYSWEDLFLSRKGIASVRQAIREERKWRMEKRSSWIVFVTAIAGLIGTLTGLLAVYRS